MQFSRVNISGVTNKKNHAQFRHILIVRSKINTGAPVKLNLSVLQPVGLGMSYQRWRPFQNFKIL